MPLTKTSRRSTCLTCLLSVAALLLGALPSLASARGSGTSARPAGTAVSTKAHKAGSSSSVWGDFYPAAPFHLTVKQPNGVAVSANLANREVGGHLETLDGYPIVKDPSSGWWYYAKAKRDRWRLVPSDRRVGIDDPPGYVRPGVGRSTSVWAAPDGSDVREEVFDFLRRASREANLRAAAAGGPRVFKFPMLMLATWWDKSKGQTGPTFQPGFTKETVLAMLNGFGGNPTGTLTEFFFENSYGQFLVQVDVYGPYASYDSAARDPITGKGECYYGNVEQEPVGGDDLDPVGNQLGIGGLGSVGMASEAVPQADPEVDFRQYDNDGDTYVDFTAIIHSGPGMEETGDPCHTWSHMLSVHDISGIVKGTVGVKEIPDGGIPTSDGVLVDRTFTMPEIGGRIGVASHEMTHALGEPDYYNTGYVAMGTGDWDIMAGGSWFGNPPQSNPIGFNPASKVFQGWVKPTVVTSTTRGIRVGPRELPPMIGYTAGVADPNLVLVPIGYAKDNTDPGNRKAANYGLVKDPSTGKYVTEGFYIEMVSRSVVGPKTYDKYTLDRSHYFDRHAHSSGLLVWHFDYYKNANLYSGTNNAQNDPNRFQMDVEEFDFNDNTQELQLNITRGDPDDLWFGAATGMTGATAGNPPDLRVGTPQANIDSGPLPAPTAVDGASFYEFTIGEFDPVTGKNANYKADIDVSWAFGGNDFDLKVQRQDPETGEWSTVGSSGAGAGVPEHVTLINPLAGKYRTELDWFAAGPDTYTVKVVFKDASATSVTMGSADTRTNDGAQTGWALTNIGPASVDGIEHSADAGGPESMTFDLVKFTAADADVSAGFVKTPASSPLPNNLLPINVGRGSRLTGTVYNNGGAKADGVTATFHLGSPAGPVIGKAQSLASIAGYGKAAASVEFTPGAEGPTDVYFVVSSTGPDAEHKNNVQKSTLIVGPPNPRVLVVDDDGAFMTEGAFTGALTALEVPWALAKGHVTADVMRSYQAVIWSGGAERYEGQLDAHDRAEVMSYLDGGGRIWFASPRILGALGEPPSRTNPPGSMIRVRFVRDYLGAKYHDTIGFIGDAGEVKGKGDPIGGTATLKLDAFPGRPLQDQAKPAVDDPNTTAVNEASNIGQGTALFDWSRGFQAGFKVVGDAPHKGFRTVTTTFALSQVCSGDHRIALTEQVLDFFGVPRGGYTPAVSQPLIHHATVRSRISGWDTPITAVVAGGKAGPVNLFYRAHSKGDYIQVPMSAGSRTGVYSATIPGSDVTPDGVDYYIRAGTASTYSPRGAAGGDLAHYISVAIPGPGGRIYKAPRALPATGAASAGAALALLLLAAAVAGRYLLRRRAA
ncbi:MAG: immune inhibitor A domain-containing protein [Actinomycetota bacterium]